MGPPMSDFGSDIGGPVHVPSPDTGMPPPSVSATLLGTRRNEPPDHIVDLKFTPVGPIVEGDGGPVTKGATVWARPPAEWIQGTGARNRGTVG